MGKKEKSKDELKNILMDNRESLLDYHKSKNYVLERKRTREFLEGDRLSPLNDVMFKTMFQNTSRKKFACYLLYAALDIGLSYEFIYRHVDFYKNVVDSNHVNDKKEIGDLVMKLDDGSIVGIELNNFNYIERNLDYASRIAASNVSVGEAYKFNTVLLINLNNYSFEKYNKQRDTFYIQNDEKILYAKRSFVEIYLPKINEKWYNGGKASMSKKEQILLCMFTSSKEIANELAEGDEILMEFNKEVESAGSNVEIITAYDRMEAERLVGHEQGYDEGREEGREEGIEQTRIKTAKDMAEQGYTLEQISKLTNFSFEELEKMEIKPKLEKLTAYDRMEAERLVGHEQGYDEGREEGREEGIKQRNIEIAKEMLKEKFSIDQIHQITKLPIDKIKELTE